MIEQSTTVSGPPVVERPPGTARAGGRTPTAAAAAAVEAPEPEVARARRGMIVLWAVIGAAWTAFCVQAGVRWVLSDDFGPAAFADDQRMPDWSFWAMRTVEILSIALALWMIWIYLLRPLVRSRRLTLDGMIVIGSLLLITIDPMINYFHYTFAWNAQALNLGTWHFTFPLASEDVGVYAEGLAWAGPMYLYLGTGMAALMIRIITWMRRRNPAVSNLRSYGTATLAMLLLDLVLEMALVRSHVYAFPRTIEAFTLFPGSEYQFPVYESLFVALFALGFCALRMSAIESPDGLSFVERGVQRIRPGARTGTRLLAVIGFCFVCGFLSYFATWSWVSNNVDSYNPKVPSYMLPTHPGGS
ncbi:hypothetical protein PAI11_20730 [Patulibacter medicamentivorans]|uniref:Spirocyclase, AveC family n=1 Tax=Patulibacter medicamentivorans TaxID=1097667 RepID=H0E5I2_9ACTN|nr:spirocyclase AveC family protein [Patulibacter medicamentivorans]EHN11057.1 hypothetical protein PAI11_20730 [Patulibacter medicamentivorans]